MEYIHAHLLISSLICLRFLQIISSAHSPRVRNSNSLLNTSNFSESENSRSLLTTSSFNVLSDRFQNDVQALRVGIKTEYTYDDDNIIALMNIHNDYRRNVTPPASDMNYVRWNVELASLADRLARLCKWEHGYPNLPNGSRTVALPFRGSVAQNIWRSSSRDPSQLTQAVTDWFNEKQYYDYNSATCKKGKVCGHYRIMTFGQLQELGCGSALCDFGFYTVCNYGPSVPDTGVPYKKGPPCAQCQSAQGWCNQGLCTMCSAEETNVTCTCELTCQNCGLLDNATCTCDCKAGWTNTDCSERCMDNRDYCKYYDQTMCADTSKARECPASCNLCEMIDQSMVDTELCCKGKLCPPGEVLDDTCYCILYAPYNTGTLNKAAWFQKWFIPAMMIVFTSLS